MSSDLLVARADQALYAAKHSGRDRVLSADKALSAFGRAQGVTPHAARKLRSR
jgi:GGDEF domain-containing protein